MLPPTDVLELIAPNAPARCTACRNTIQPAGRMSNYRVQGDGYRIAEHAFANDYEDRVSPSCRSCGAGTLCESSSRCSRLEQYRRPASEYTR
jgi:hypothetical protein